MKSSLRIASPAVLLAWLLVTFLVLFPKGGIKVADVPLTWGYLFLGLSFVPLLAMRFLLHPLRQSVPGLLAAASILPFQLVFCYSFLQNGVGSVAYAVAIVTGFFFLPTIFLFVYPSFLSFVDGHRFRRHFCFCILAAALWGIFLFFYHPIAGKYIEIPLLTVNAGDYGVLETTKHIDRGGYLKLISTYNNGNLYGIATLILLPLFLKLEPALWKRNVVRIALVLTLSRTVWLGLILEQALSVLAQMPDLLGRFPRVRPGKALKQGAILLATVGLVLVGTIFFQASAAAFLLDRNLGGRADELTNVGDPGLLPNVPLTTFDEVLYASALRNYGILGLLAVLLIFFGPILFLVGMPSILRAPVRRAAAKGLILYAFVAAADGATVLIPVMAFYWFAYMTMLYGLPGDQIPRFPARRSRNSRWLIAPSSATISPGTISP